MRTLKRNLVRLCGAIASFAGCAANTNASDRIAELERRVARLEQSLAARAPVSSHDRPAEVVPGETGWIVSGGGRAVYDIRPDAGMQRMGHPTLLLAPNADTGGKYGTWMRSVEATPYRGKRVRLSAYTRTDGTTRRADFWARIQAWDSPGDGPGLGGRWVRLPPTSDWTHQEIVLDVPPEGAMVQYGVGIAGPGRLWVDQPKLETVGADVPTTNR